MELKAQKEMATGEKHQQSSLNCLHSIAEFRKELEQVTPAHEHSVAHTEIEAATSISGFLGGVRHVAYFDPALGMLTWGLPLPCSLAILSA